MKGKTMDYILATKFQTKEKEEEEEGTKNEYSEFDFFSVCNIFGLFQYIVKYLDTKSLLNVTESSLIKQLVENNCNMSFNYYLRRYTENPRRLRDLYKRYKEELSHFEDGESHDNEEYVIRGRTLFIRAIQAGRKNDVELFVNLHPFSKYIKINEMNENDTMNLKDMVNQASGGSMYFSYECIALNAAAYFGHYEIVEYLVNILYEHEELNSLVHEYYEEFPEATPFIAACEKGRLEDVKLFITGHDAKATGVTVTDMVNLSGKTVHGDMECTALNAAVQEEQFHVVQYLIEQCGANPSITTSEGWGALHVAAQYSTKSTDIMNLLLNNMPIGNGINRKGWYETTPLDRAIENNNSLIKDEIIALIRSHGGKANFHDANGNKVPCSEGELSVRSATL